MCPWHRAARGTSAVRLRERTQLRGCRHSLTHLRVLRFVSGHASPETVPEAGCQMRPAGICGCSVDEGFPARGLAYYSAMNATSVLFALYTFTHWEPDRTNHAKLPGPVREKGNLRTDIQEGDKMGPNTSPERPHGVVTMSTPKTPKMVSGAPPPRAKNKPRIPGTVINVMSPELGRPMKRCRTNRPPGIEKRRHQ